MIDKEVTVGKQFQTVQGKVQVYQVEGQNEVYTFFMNLDHDGIKFTKDELVELRNLINATLADDSHMTEAAQAHARAGRKIDAIKAVREHSTLYGGSMGLKEAKDLVEAWMQNNIQEARAKEAFPEDDKIPSLPWKAL